MMAFDTDQFRNELKDLPRFLISFIKNPVQGIRTAPPLSWPALFSLQIGAAIISGALVGLTERSFFDFLVGIFIYPVSSLVLSVIFTLFIYYFFSLFHGTFLEFRRLYGLLVLANLPYFIFHAAAGFLPPIDLIGFAFTCVLLIVGLVEQFGLERKKVTRLVGALYLVFFLIWAVEQYRANHDEAQRLEEIQNRPSSARTHRPACDKLS
jgi:hypothetical protein